MFTALLLCVSLAGCMSGSNRNLMTPPEHESEGIVVAIGNTAIKAELRVEPADVGPGDRCRLTVVNHGEIPLWFGRPVTVERWDGEDWVETAASREAFWTMDLLWAAPGEEGPQQEWPFGAERGEVKPGWYRFTKQVSAEGETESPVTLVLRARVLRRGP